MRFMMLLKADSVTEAGVLPGREDGLPGTGRAPEIELRQMFELTDFADVPPVITELDKTLQAVRERGKK